MVEMLPTQHNLLFFLPALGVNLNNNHETSHRSFLDAVGIAFGLMTIAFLAGLALLHRAGVFVIPQLYQILSSSVVPKQSVDANMVF